MNEMSDQGPAATIRRAVAQIRDPVFCGDRAAPAVADWLDSLNGIDWSEHHSYSDELMYALKVARAYLGEPS